MQQYCNGHNYIQNFAMFIITLKTTLNDKVGYHFCQQVMLLFWLQQKVVQFTNYEI